MLQVAALPVMYSLQLLAVGLIILAVYLLAFYDRIKIPPGLKPLPGPPGRPLIGNFGQFDPVAPYSAFQKLARQYGPIFQVKQGSQVIISVNDPVIAKDLFEKRGNLYNSRISTHVGFDLLSEGSRIAMVPHGPRHMTFRKQLHRILSISKSKDNQIYQELESRQVLHDFLKMSDKGKIEEDVTQVEMIFRRYTSSVMLTLAFAHRIKNFADDQIVGKIYEVMGVFRYASQPGTFWVDTFPALKMLPRFLRTWETWAENQMAWQRPFMQGLLNQVEDQMKRGIPNQGFIRLLVEERKDMTEKEREENFLDDKSIRFQSMTTMEAGAETTSITMMNFTLAMLLHPDSQKKGQACVDAVVGEDRLPSFDDIPKLQYVNQIVKEVLRWRPVITLGGPHSNTAADSYNGYHIPKDSIVLGNIWNMHHDDSHYPNADEFVPERYETLTKSVFESAQEPNALDRDHYAFGWVSITSSLPLPFQETEIIPNNHSFPGPPHLLRHAPRRAQCPNRIRPPALGLRHPPRPRQPGSPYPGLCGPKHGISA